MPKFEVLRLLGEDLRKLGYLAIAKNLFKIVIPINYKGMKSVLSFDLKL